MALPKLSKIELNIKLLILTLFLILSSTALHTFLVETNKLVPKNKPLRGQVLQAVSCDHTVTSDTELETVNESVQAGETVCLETADYSHTSINPTASGAEGSRIIYQNLPDHNVIVNELVDLSGKSYITVSGINIELHSDTWTHRYVDLRNSNNIIIENCNMASIPKDKPGHCPVWLDNASYSVLRNNYIEGSNATYNDLIHLGKNSHHNLIENNRLNQGSHTLLSIAGYYNIIRNNRFVNDYHHCVGASNYLNVFEGNVFARCGNGVHNNPEAYYPSFAWGDFHAWQDEGIYRNNIILNSGRNDDPDYPSWGSAIHAVSSTYGETLITMLNNRWYHNIIYGNHGWGLQLGIYHRSDYEGNEYRDNKFINNILYNNGLLYEDGDLEIQYVHYAEGGAPSPADVQGDEWRGNLIGNFGQKTIKWNSELMTLEEASTRSNPVFDKNTSGAPNFVNIIEDTTGEWGKIDPSSDFHLASGSPAIDGGDFLTYTSSSDSGNQVSVTDARFFIDGFGIVDGDTIRIGSEVVTITHTDYESNTLTVNRSLSWSSGTGVSFPYSGLSPDIGAFEYGGISEPTPTTPPGTSIPTPGVTEPTPTSTSSVEENDPIRTMALTYSGCYELGDGAVTLASLECVFENAIKAFLGLAAIILFVVILVAGFKYITSGGDPKAVQSAKMTLTYAIGGMVLIALSFLILQFISVFTGADVTDFTVTTP